MTLIKYLYYEITLSTIMDKMDKNTTGDQSTRKYGNTFFATFVLSAVAACAAEIATYPFDLTKTRLQIQGEIATIRHGNKKTMYRGMISTAIGIAREEGVSRLFQGITPALQRQIIYSGCRVVFYEWLRNNLFTMGSNDISIWKSTACGVTAGVTAQYLASPADLIKVQMQMEGRRRLLGLPPRVVTVRGAFMGILREGGVRGLWKGAAPNSVRAAMVNIGDLTTYDLAKRTLVTHTGLKDGTLLHSLAAVVAGLASAGLATPADVVKTRVMNQPTDDHGRGMVYTSSVDCLRKTVSNEGVLALYKGFVPVWIRMGPWAFIFWLSLEKLRTFAGLDNF